MHLSAEHGHNGNVSILLEHDSNIHIRDANEMTPLNLAEKGGHVKCVKLLKDAAGKFAITLMQLYLVQLQLFV